MKTVTSEEPQLSQSGKRDIYLCAGCGYRDQTVECAGIYFCPNKLCTMCGANCHKNELQSYTPDSDGNVTVDPEEVYDWGLELIRNETNVELRKAMKRSLKYWELCYILPNILEG